MNVTAAISKPQTKEEWLAVRPEVKTKVGPCPLCAKPHSYQRKFSWGTLEWPSSLLKTCPKYESWNPVQRGKKLEELQGCARLCLTSWKHQHGRRGCMRGSSISCTTKDQGKTCGGDHDSSLQGSGSQYCSAAGVTAWEVVAEAHHNPGCDRYAPVLLEMQQVDLAVNGTKVDTVVFFDNGATTTLCTHAWAAKAGLSGENVSYYLRV